MVVPISVALFCIPHYVSLNSIYFSLEYHGVEPNTEGLPLIYIPAPVPLLVLDPFVYQIKSLLWSGLNLFCCTHLSRNLTVNDL